MPELPWVLTCGFQTFIINNACTEPFPLPSLKVVFVCFRPRLQQFVYATDSAGKTGWQRFQEYKNYTYIVISLCCLPLWLSLSFPVAHLFHFLSFSLSFGLYPLFFLFLCLFFLFFVLFLFLFLFSFSLLFSCLLFLLHKACLCCDLVMFHVVDICPMP